MTEAEKLAKRRINLDASSPLHWDDPKTNENLMITDGKGSDLPPSDGISKDGVIGK
jgi:hypothetical protein